MHYSFVSGSIIISYGSVSQFVNDKTGPLIKYSCNISKFAKDKIILLLDDKKTREQNNDTTVAAVNDLHASVVRLQLILFSKDIGAF